MGNRKNEITYHNKDVLSKILAENFKDKSLKVYGIDVPKIKQILPTNLPQIQVNEMRIDNLFLLEDDSIAIIDYESDVKWENHLKYLIYIVRILERYKKDDFETTVRSLRSVAGSLKLCDNPRLKELGYRRMDFFSHRYFMM